ncbi:uncharacterized protein LOC128956780 [Oppia nitens]|uniref:uncharacterized protein LOC128956780 n=1 Tax=Oppia nitens TaxID=1686743 RepID=UPI0023DA75E8|nr:uncharacterized protein LOC128956780 [Oppia nitens]
MLSQVFLYIVLINTIFVEYIESIETKIQGHCRKFENLAITPMQYIDCTFLNLFECKSDPDSSVDIVEILMPEMLNNSMTCNGIITDNHKDNPFDLVLSNGEIHKVVYSEYNLIVTIIDGDNYYREVGLFNDGPCAGSKVQGWSIYLAPEGQCITKPMTSSKPLFEHLKITGNCKATCSGHSMFSYKPGIVP